MTTTHLTEFQQFTPTTQVSDTNASTISGSNAIPRRRNSNHRLSRIHPYQRPQTRPSWLKRVCNAEFCG